MSKWKFVCEGESRNGGVMRTCPNCREYPEFQAACAKSYSHQCYLLHRSVLWVMASVKWELFRPINRRIHPVLEKLLKPKQ